jgi:hypothetical protein
VSGLATLGDALRRPVNAVLLHLQNGFVERMGIVGKLEKIGVHVVRETGPSTVVRATFEAADCVVLIEGCATEGDRDALLRIAADTKIPVFFLHAKVSHASWARLEEFAKRKGASNVIPIKDDERIVYTKGPIPTAPKSEPQKKLDAPVIERVTERFILETEKEAEIARIKSESEALRALYDEENAKITRERDEAAAKLTEASLTIAALRSERDAGVKREMKQVDDFARLREEHEEGRDKEVNERVSSLLSLLDAKTVFEAEEAIQKLRLTQGKRAGGIAGQAERWKREYKARAEAAEARVAELETEAKALRTKKAPKIDETKVRALLIALDVKAISPEFVTAAILQLVKGES